MSTEEQKTVVEATPAGATEKPAEAAAAPAAAAAAGASAAAEGADGAAAGDATEATPAAAAAAAAAPGAFSSSSLYVGDLLTDVTEAQLFEVFNVAGPVASIRVCRDSITRRSLGYAYVNFHNATDAERALDTLNFADVKGNPCRIMWSQRDPAVRKTGVGNVFIKSLDKTIDNKALYDTFSAFGNILSCKVVLDEHGESKGYGFVHFETAEAANDAIAKVDGMQLGEKVVYVGHFIPRKEREDTGEGNTKFTNVFVKNIPEEVTEEQLSEEFTKHGKITSAVLMADDAGKSRGFGFVCFESTEDASKAVEALNQSEVWGKPLFVGRAQKRSEREAELKRRYEELKQERQSQYQGVNLYVKHIDDQIDEDRLRQEFAHCGMITSTKIMRDEKGVSKGFGFVCFSNTEEATRAVTEMNGKMVASKPLYVALAQRGTERRQHLAQQYAQRANTMRMQQASMGGMAAPMPYPANGAFIYNPMGGPQGGAMRGGPGNMMYPTSMPMRSRWQPQPGNPGMQQYGGQQGGQRSGGPYMNYGAAAGMQQQGNGMQGNGMQRGPGGRGAPRSGNGGGMGGNRSGMPPQGMGAMNGMQGGNRGGSGGPGYNKGVYQQQQQGQQQQMRGPPQQQQQQQMMMPVMANPQMVAADPQLTAAALASASPQQQKQMIGERLYIMISSAHPMMAGKITGMLLEMEVTELLNLLDNPDELNARIDEAVQVLRAHQAQTDAASAAPAAAVATPAE